MHKLKNHRNSHDALAPAWEIPSRQNDSATAAAPAHAEGLCRKIAHRDRPLPNAQEHNEKQMKWLTSASGMSDTSGRKLYRAPKPKLRKNPAADSSPSRMCTAQVAARNPLLTRLALTCACLDHRNNRHMNQLMCACTRPYRSTNSAAGPLPPKCINQICRNNTIVDPAFFRLRRSKLSFFCKWRASISP